MKLARVSFNHEQFRGVACVVSLFLVVQSAAGQPPSAARPAPAPPGGGPAAPVIVSPEVQADRRVVVRLYAPNARAVSVFFERGDHAMSKGDDGVWQATLGPLEPGSYRYGFAVDGMPATDPRNVETERMQVVTRSIVHVPGAAFMDATDVPHGAVAVVTYHSSVLKKLRRLHVYTPPGYGSSAQNYPVLYLLHGANESDQSWSTVGRAGFILDNLIAEGKAAPMIVVMPNGHADQAPPNLTGSGTRLRAEFTDVPLEFAADIKPYIERNYSDDRGSCTPGHRRTVDGRAPGTRHRVCEPRSVLRRRRLQLWHHRRKRRGLGKPAQHGAR